MAFAPRKRCAFAHCRAKVNAKERYCTEHTKAQRSQHDNTRPSAARRGYDHRWRAYRLRYLKENPLCVRCKSEQRITPATVVDHITPVENGQSDPLFWEPANHQALCHYCHNWKTRVIDKRGFGS